MKELEINIFKRKHNIIGVLLIIMFSCNFSDNHQKTDQMKKETKDLKTYVIEREVENVGSSTPIELKDIAKNSNAALKELGPDIKWQHSYIVGDKTYCVYKAKNKSLIKEHARKAGAPANTISQVTAVLDPQSAE